MTGLFASLFYFPIETYAYPGVNSKMVLAVVGLACIGWHLVKLRSATIGRNFFWLIVSAAAVSIASLLSVTINHTPDNAYVGYLISFTVWLSAAFAVCSSMKWTHGKVTVQLAVDYLAGACLFQCIAALVIEFNPGIQNWVDSYFNMMQDFMHRTNRLYGLGALLDVSGIRFTCILICIAYYLAEINTSLSIGRYVVYLLMFMAITVIGNMIARTTLVGSAIGIVIVLLSPLLRRRSHVFRENLFYKILIWGAALLLVISACVMTYNSDSNARKLYRFGFEGFFSLAEKGVWEVSSNERLKTMIVFPESLHTWVIGDGYFENYDDVNYLGDDTSDGFYMGTDIGYLRFIFYFGIAGLCTIIAVMAQAAAICMRTFRRDRLLFAAILLAQAIIFLKVSTDVFPFFAMFLSTAALVDEPEANA